MDHIENSLHHLYISPLEQCNLCCKMCYTTKTSDRLTNEQIHTFVKRYNQEVSIQSITFCGGEVFLLPQFTTLVNQLTDMGIFIQIITNGSINLLSEIKHPNNCNLIVSIDGVPSYHDQNRGANRWQQAVGFLKDGLKQGFHAEVFSIITKENIGYINEYERLLQEKTGQHISVTYHPRKPITYLQAHPTSNQIGETEGFSFISPHEREKLSQQKNIFPPKNRGCYQISVMSDGQVYGCCEGIRPLGTITTDIKSLINTFRSRIDKKSDCIEPDFVCGLK
jgi:MoaA/NifB/PqqE/SkfB family radical SAM enzyme